MGEIAKVSASRAISPAQSTAISFVDDHGDKIVLTSDDVRMHICPKADAKEVAYFMELCRAQRLNPFLNEAYLVKFGSNPAQIMVAHKALVKRAEQHPQYDGMEHGVVIIDANGQRVERPGGAFYNELGETLIGGWAKVYRKDRRMPIYAERSLKSMDKNQANWKSMPDVMIDKCAQAAALREAFPDELRSMYTTEEMGSTEQAITPDSVEAPPESKTRIPYSKPQTMPAEDLAYLKESTAQLVAMGFEEPEVKRFLWETYRAEGRDSVHAWVDAQLAPQPETQAEAVAVAVEIADEDIPFPDEA